MKFIATEFIKGETLRLRLQNAPLKLGEVLIRRADRRALSLLMLRASSIVTSSPRTSSCGATAS